MESIIHHEDMALPLPNNSDGSIWVFGYASLIWDPGFEHTQACKAQVIGYHRSFCVWSTTYRGTEESPGLVMGLDQGGFCHGKAFEVDQRYLHDTMDYLYQREMDTFAYIPTICPIRLCENDSQQNKTIEALTFVVNPQMPVYANGLSVTKKAEVINRAYGSRGANLDYVMNTYEHLQDMDIDDSYLRSIIDQL